MLKSSRLELYRLLNTKNFKTHQFRINHNERKQTTTIFFLKEPRFFFEIVENPDYYGLFRGNYSTFDKKFPVATFASDWANFPSVAIGVEKWLIQIHAWRAEFDDESIENSAPRILLNAPEVDSATDESFSESDTAYIKAQFAIASQYIQELNIPEDRLRDYEIKVDELVELTKSLGKVSWKEKAKEVLINVVINLATNKDTYSLISQVFSNLTGYLLPSAY